jgi:ankyrin repeat protein
MKSYFYVNIALKNNDVELMKELIKDKNNDINYEENFVLVYASQYNYIEMFELFIKSNRIRKTRIPLQGFEYAVSFLNIEIIEMYLKQKKLKKLQKEIKENSIRLFFNFIETHLESGNDLTKIMKIKLKELIDIFLKNFNRVELLKELKKDEYIYSSFYNFYGKYLIEEKIKEF